MGKERLSSPPHKTLLTTNWKWAGAYVRPIGILSHQNLPPVGNKGRVIGRGGLEWDVVEAGFLSPAY